MKCFSCCKVPKQFLTLHLKDRIVPVCNKCLDSRKVILCENIYNLHEHDDFAVYMNLDTPHCIECFKHEKKLLLKRYNPFQSIKNLSSKILEYV